MFIRDSYVRKKRRSKQKRNTIGAKRAMISKERENDWIKQMVIQNQNEYCLLNILMHLIGIVSIKSIILCVYLFVNLSRNVFANVTQFDAIVDVWENEVLFSFFFSLANERTREHKSITSVDWSYANDSLHFNCSV